MIKKIEPIDESITISIPAFNERESLEWVVREALEVLPLATKSDYEVLIVDDGSTDGTQQLAHRLAKELKKVRVYTHLRNLGFHAAQHSCYIQAQGNRVFLLPADGQVSPWVLGDFLKISNNADLILGTHESRSGRWSYVLPTHLYHFIISYIFNLRFDEFGACIFLRRGLYLDLKIRSTTPVAMTELVVKALKVGAKVKEVSVRTRPRRKGYSKAENLYWKIPRIIYDIWRLYLEVRSSRF